MEEDKKSVGPAVGIVIIIIVLLIGGYYFWSSKIANKKAPVVNQEQTANLPATTTSIGDMENDLNSVNIDSVGSDLLNDSDFK
jgi:flagellar basal body-associated protein FliL